MISDSGNDGRYLNYYNNVTIHSIKNKKQRQGRILDHFLSNSTTHRPSPISRFSSSPTESPITLPTIIPRLTPIPTTIPTHSPTFNPTTRKPKATKRPSPPHANRKLRKYLPLLRLGIQPHANLKLRSDLPPLRLGIQPHATRKLRLLKSQRDIQHLYRPKYHPWNHRCCDHSTCQLLNSRWVKIPYAKNVLTKV